MTPDEMVNHQKVEWANLDWATAGQFSYDKWKALLDALVLEYPMGTPFGIHYLIDEPLTREPWRKP